MRELICRAIRQRKVLQFYYNGHLRTVEPYAYGVTTAGNRALRGYQTSTGSESGDVPGWHLFAESGIRSLRTTGAPCTVRRDGYVQGDSGMSTIYCEL